MNKNVGPFLAFGPAWFERHQRGLLRLLRWRLFRWILRIDCDREIIEIRPHCYTVALDEPDTYRTDFRTHWKYSKRIYFAFRPLWWGLHFWDWLIADRFVPRWSFSLSTLTVYPDPNPETTTVDGAISRDTAGENWATIRSGAGSSPLDDLSDQVFVGAAAVGGLWTSLYRYIALFNTALLASDHVIVEAKFCYVGYAGSNGPADGNNMPMDVVVVSSNPASNTALVTTDFSSLGVTAFSDVKLWSTLVNNAYNVFLLNVAGQAAITVGGITKLGLKEYTHDALGNTPGIANSISRADGFSADNTGTGNDPKLVVTYSVHNFVTPRNPTSRPRPWAPGIAR